MGTELVKHLLERGCVVVGVGRREKGFLSDEQLRHPGFEFARLDLTLDDLSAGYFAGVSGIYHLAAHQPGGGGSYSEYHEGNVASLFRVVELGKALGVKFINLVSSTAIFGGLLGDEPLTETMAPSPNNYYSLTKHMSEHVLRLELLNTGIKAIVVRFPSIFGKNHLGGLVHTFYEAIFAGDAVEIFSRGERLRNLVHASDAVRLLSSVGENAEALSDFEIFNGGGADSRSMADIAQILKDSLDSSSEIVLADKYPSSDQDIRIDISKANKLLGFSPMVIHEGLKIYVEEKKS